MNLREYLRVLRRGWPIIVGLTMLGTIAGIALVLSTTKEYQASAQVFVAPAPSIASTGSDLNNGNTYIQDRVQSYTSIANSPTVTRRVIRSLDLGITPSELADKISADAPLNKVLINIHVVDASPSEAARLANAVADAFNSTVESTEQTDSSGKPVVKLTVIHPAATPTAPIKPNKLLEIGGGFGLGLILGLGIVVIRDLLDNSVKSPADFAEFDLPVLGLVPFDKRTPSTPIAFRDDPHGARSEAYRQLRTNLQFVNVDDAPRIIAVTSAVPGEGKTTTALNLASALAEAGFRTCLIEADLRRPTLAKVLDIVGEVGFTTTLIGRATATEVMQPLSRNLAVLTSGPVPPNPSELLITQQARTVIREVSELCDFTIIDTAPLLPVADGAEVAAMADATIVVHHSGKSTREQVSRSLEALAKVGERPVGTVLNMLARNRSAGAYYYGYSYAYRPARNDPSKARHSRGDSAPNDDVVEAQDR